MEKRGENRKKKAVEIMTTTYFMILLIILALFIVITFWDFQTGKFSSFLDRVFRRTNLDKWIESCNSLASKNSGYNYCCIRRGVNYKLNGTFIVEELTCRELAEKTFTEGRVNKLNCENVWC